VEVFFYAMLPDFEKERFFLESSHGSPICVRGKGNQ